MVCRPSLVTPWGTLALVPKHLLRWSRHNSHWSRWTWSSLRESIGNYRAIIMGAEARSGTSVGISCPMVSKTLLRVVQAWLSLDQVGSGQAQGLYGNL